MEALSQRWRAAAFDQRGSGETTCAPAAITLDAMVDDVFATMDALGIGRCVLGAESRGMIVAVRAALARPERFDGLVLVAGQPSFAARSPQSEAFLRRVREDLPGVVAGLVERFLPEPDVEHLKRWGRHIGSRTAPETAVAAQEAFLGADVRPHLGSLAVPTLLVHGTLDAAVPRSIAAENAAAIPRSTLVELDGTGHGPTLVRPRDVAGAIDEHFGAR